MDELIAGYFPRIHTAIAEWMACVAFLLPLRFKGIKAGRFAASFLFLALLLITFQIMDSCRAQGILWILLMITGSILMLLFIYINRRRGWADALYVWAHAFLMAELAASLEWQINYYLLISGVASTIDQTYVCMLAIYLLVFGAVYYRRRKTEARATGKTTCREAFSVVGIAVGAFVISNVQFAFQNNLFFNSLGAGVLYVRTLVDVSGVIMLNTNGEQRREMHLRYELDAMNNLLQRQYEQYQLYEANNEAMHRVYHDLKHQIAYLENETNREKRMAGLKEMKETIRINESRVKTGNSVLDILLTSKSLICADEGILMTCYADAHMLDFLDVMDALSIFGNTIDNAIEYERKVKDTEDRLIKVHVGVNGVFLFIRIENFCDQQVAFDGDIPLTTKEDKQFHGFGLKSVYRCVKKTGAISIWSRRTAGLW